MTAPAVGRVEALDVREGEAVVEGQLLYRLALDSMTPVGATQAQIERLMTAQRRELDDEIVRQRDVVVNTLSGFTKRLRRVRCGWSRVWGICSITPCPSKSSTRSKLL